MIKNVVCNLIPLVMVIIAAAMIFCGKEGWGWFLFLALVMYVVPSERKTK